MPIEPWPELTWSSTLVKLARAAFALSTVCFKLLAAMEKFGLRCEPERTEHLFRSRVAARLREVFIRRPYFWLPLFVFFYCAVRLADWAMDDMHGQIIIVTAKR